MKYEDPIYGEVEFTELEKKIIENSGMQRLKKIHQNGADFLIKPEMDTSRFEHSLGVAILCKKFGADEEEEVIAALVHDISHTAFSHLADQVFERRDQTYHEDHHERFVKDFGLDTLVQEHGYNPDYIFDEDNFGILERDRPDICADRLDYTLRDLFKAGLIDQETVDRVLKGLTIEDGLIVAKDKKTASEVMDLFFTLNKQVFFDKKSEGVKMLMKDILSRGLEEGLISEEDLFKTDQEVMDKLSEDRGLKEKIQSIKNGVTVEVDGGEGLKVTRKHRIVDPKIQGTGDRLTELEPEAEKRFEEFKSEVPKEASYEVWVD